MSLTGFLSYSRVNWQQSPSKSTPLSAANLNVMDAGIKNNNDMISNIRDEVTQLNSNITNNICTNLLNPTLETSSQNGVTCTNNGDGTYTLNGTASSQVILNIMTSVENKFIGNKLLGCPSGGTNATYSLLSSNFSEDNSWLSEDYDVGNGIIIKNSPKINVSILIRSGTVCNNLVFKPMITTNLNATYDDFVSYTGNTGKLNGDVAQLCNNFEKLDGLSIRRGSFMANLSVGTNNIKIRGSASDKVIEGTLPSSCNAIINTFRIDKDNSFDWSYHFDSMGAALYIYTNIEQQIRFEWIEFL